METGLMEMAMDGAALSLSPSVSNLLELQFAQFLSLGDSSLFT